MSTDMGTIYPIAIIGSGAGGTMAAERASLNNRDTVLFTGAKKEMKRSRGRWVRQVDNIPGLAKYTRTLVELREETLKKIESGPFAKKLHVVHDSVVSIKKEDEVFVLVDKTGKTFRASHVILATGIMDEQPEINGSIKPILPYANKQLVNYCILCDGHRSHQKKTVVIGHSEDAAQAALVLADRYQQVALTILTNGKEPTITQETLELLKAKNIDVFKNPIVGIDGNKKERVLNGFTLDSGKLVEAEVGFVSLGIRPNNQFALDLGANVDAKGLVVANEECESSIANLYVIGDLRSNSKKQIYTAWNHAVEAVQAIDRKIRTSHSSLHG